MAFTDKPPPLRYYCHIALLPPAMRDDATCCFIFTLFACHADMLLPDVMRDALYAYYRCALCLIFYIAAADIDVRVFLHTRCYAMLPPDGAYFVIRRRC